MTTAIRRRMWMFAALFFAVFAIPATAIGQTITGTVYAFSGRAAGRSAPFRLIVNRYTTDAEAARFNEALRSGGQDALLRVLSKEEAGRIEIGSGIGVPANAILSEKLANGETKLTVIFERDIRFSELRYGARRADYRFGYAELYLNPNGEGGGMFIPAAMIRIRDGNTWEVEDFGTFPARLLGLRVRDRREPRE